MELCPNHQHALRLELEARGLGGYIAEDMAEIERRIDRARYEGMSIDSFDPLYQGSYNILNNCAHLATINGDLHIHLVLGCTLCHVMKRYPRASNYQAWIPAAAEGMLKMHQRLVNG